QGGRHAEADDDADEDAEQRPAERAVARWRTVQRAGAGSACGHGGTWIAHAPFKTRGGARTRVTSRRGRECREWRVRFATPGPRRRPTRAALRAASRRRRESAR